jgi:hypothetical protein
MPSAAWRTERGGSGGGIRTRTVASFEEADSADWSTPLWVGTPGAIRTRTSCGLNAVTPTSWSTGAFFMKIGAPCMDSNPRPAPYRGAALPTELTEQMNKRLQQPTGAAGSLFLDVHNVKQRDPKRDCHPALGYYWSMMISENRYPLFGIMLRVQVSSACATVRRQLSCSGTRASALRADAASIRRAHARPAEKALLGNSAGPLALLPVGGGLFYPPPG